MFIAGIDGGGTKTRLELRDTSGNFIDRMEFGPFNINAIGAAAFAERLDEVFRACGDMKDCASLCIGSAGISRSETADIIRKSLQQAGFSGQLRLCGDSEIALRGAFDGPGIILIAGTGSIAYGVNAEGSRGRVGGYGHLIDDCGSGYAIGRDALEYTVQALDGRNQASALAEAVMSRIGARSDRDIVDYVYALSTGKAGIADLAPTVIAAAEAGDEHASEILDREADALVLMVLTLAGKLGLPEGRTTALAGGLLKRETRYRGIVRAKLSGSCTVIAPARDALSGAVLLAAEAL